MGCDGVKAHDPEEQNFLLLFFKEEALPHLLPC
jgi:hypothetical protein